MLYPERACIRFPRRRAIRLPALLHKQLHSKQPRVRPLRVSWGGSRTGALGVTSLRSPRAPLPGGPGSVFTSPWSPSPPKATLLMDRRWCLVTGLFLSLAASLRALSLTCQAFGLTLFEFTTSVRLSSGCSVAQSGPALCNPTDYRVSLSFTMSRSLLKLTIIESGMPSNHLVLCHPSPPALNLSQSQGLFK